ncbi:uroporphyrinogen-III synthase [Nitrincola sp. MINF-07-Sa-05]|uniref:uroporphyrinogen-III synthase n=1 Tax=Nitrincola salilacus TaxID=3400273 RepID=UPI003918275A
MTRPSHQSQRQIELISSLGGQAVPLPLLQIEPVGESDTTDYLQLKRCILDLDLYHGVIFVSANAARQGAAWIDTYWPQPPLGVQWIGIGRQTSETLQNLGFDAWYQSGGFDSEALLQAESLQQIKGQRFLILRGDSGRELLYDTLSARGARVDCATVYYRRCPRYPQAIVQSTIYDQPISAMLVTSGDGLSNLMQITDQASDTQRKKLFETQLILPSLRIARLAEQLGFTQITIAQGPDDQSMVQALIPANKLEKPA